MSNRLNKERQAELEPKRMEYAIEKLGELSIAAVDIDGKELQFEWRGNTIRLFVYSGWYQGAGITPGRGIKELIKVLKAQKNAVICTCGATMVKRKNSKDGSQFYGCSAYPKCKHTKPLKKLI